MVSAEPPDDPKPSVPCRAWGLGLPRHQARAAGLRAPGGQAGQPAASGNPSGSHAAETRCQKGSCRGPRASQPAGRLRVRRSPSGCRERGAGRVVTGSGYPSPTGTFLLHQEPSSARVQSRQLTRPVAHPPHPYRKTGLGILPGQSQHHNQPRCPLECLRTRGAKGPPPAGHIGRLQCRHHQEQM